MKTHIATIAVVLLAAGVANAGAFAQESLALGYQAEHADLVAMGSLVGAERDAAGNYRVTFSVTEVIRGKSEAGTSVVVAYPDLGQRPPWRADHAHLLFLSRRGEESAFLPVSGPYSIRAIPASGGVLSWRTRSRGWCGARRRTSCAGAISTRGCRRPSGSRCWRRSWGTRTGRRARTRW